MSTKHVIKEVVLAANTYCYLLDRTDGTVMVLNGPAFHKNNEETQQPVVWDEDKQRVVPVALDRAIQSVTTVPVGHYAIISNPVFNDKQELQWPRGKSNPTTNVTLQMGRKVVVHGPTSLTPWPGQTVDVKAGYTLKATQYLRCEVYDPALTTMDGAQIGDEFIVRGDEHRFYMPPSGVTVLSTAPEDPEVLGPFDWLLVANTNPATAEGFDGVQRYRHGPSSYVPPRGEQIIARGTAVDLSTHQVIVRCIDDQSPDFGELRRIAGDGGQRLYWPGFHEEIVNTIPINDVPAQHYVWVTRADGTAETIEGPARFFHNALTESVSPAQSFVRVTDGRAAIMRRDDGVTEIVKGPAAFAPKPAFTMVSQIRLRSDVGLSLTAMTADLVGVTAVVTVKYRLDPEDERAWPHANEAGLRTALSSHLANSVQRHNTLECFDNMQAVLNDELKDFVWPAPYQLDGGCFVDSMAFSEKSIVDTIVQERRASLMHRFMQAANERALAKIEIESTLADAKAVADRHNVDVATTTQRHKTLAQLSAEAEGHRARHANDMLALEHAKAVALANTAVNEIQRADDIAAQATLLEKERAELEISMQRLDAEAAAKVRVLSAITPQLTAALDGYGKTKVFEAAVKNLAPTALAQDMGLKEVTDRLLTGTVLEGLMKGNNGIQKESHA